MSVYNPKQELPLDEAMIPWRSRLKFRTFNLGKVKYGVFLISNFRCVLNVACFLLGNSPASEFYMPTFRNTVCFIFIGRQLRVEWFYTQLPAYEDGTECSETSAYKIQTPENYPKESIQNTECWWEWCVRRYRVIRVSPTWRYNSFIKIPTRYEMQLILFIWFFLQPKPHTQTQEHNKSGVYALTCNTCKQAYIGQTSRNLKQRYQEHTRYIRNNDPQSAYALHILKNQHEYGPMNDTMTLLKQEHKTPMLISYEQLFIQTYHKHGLLIQEQHMGDTNPLFQLITHTNKTNTLKY